MHACIMLDIYPASKNHGYKHDMKKKFVVIFTWVTQPECPKAEKDEVKRPKGLPTRSRGPEEP